MTEIQIDIPVNFEVEMTDEEWTDFILHHRRLKPAQMQASSAHAESLEYGTGPLCEYQPTVEGGAYTWESIYAGLDRWARLKLKKEKTHSEFAYDLTNKFWLEGMKPHPYFRPAMEWVVNNIQKKFDEGYSIYEILDEALRVAYKCMEEQNLFFTGELVQSMNVKELSPEDGHTEDIDAMLERAWDKAVESHRSE